MRLCACRLYSGCYVEADGNDYRGTKNVTVDGTECAVWSDPKLDAAYVRSFGASSTWKPENYPDAGLGGHNYCRNPDHGVGKCNNGTDCSQPWCLYWEDAKKRKKLGWAYCDVGAPSASCPGKPSYAPADPVPLSWSGKSGASQSGHAEGHVKEHKYNYYSLSVPAALKGLLIVLVPTSSGPSPRLFADFDVHNPTGHTASYDVTSSSGGVSELRLMRTQSGFCGNSPLGVLAECTPYLGVVGREDADYSLLVYDMAHPAENICAASCDWSSLGDGDCDTQCKNAACFFDRGDCDLAENTGCPKDCDPNYIGDGQRDHACFTLKCGWDGGDFGATEGCADYCQPNMANNGVCDAQCNVASCDFDGADCFHRHSECYTRPNGYDYRGTVSHTKSGKQCQVWSDQTPHAHTMSVRNWPSEGLGGHNFCRNPDQSEDQPWCYVAEPQLDENGVPIDAPGNRFETCDVGAVSLDKCIAPPPPPLPPGRPARHWPHLPPSPALPPAPPPPEPCPEKCAELANNGECDQDCNSTQCLWDKGDCGDLMAHLLHSLGDSFTERTAARLKLLMSGELRASARQYGMALGVLVTFVAIVVCLCMKRARRLRQIAKRSGGVKNARSYTAYGESAGPGGGTELPDILE